MCSRILWNNNKLAVVVGRTMDWPDGTDPKITVFPREKETIEVIFDRLLGKERDDGSSASSSSIERSLKAAQPLIQRLQMLLDNSGVLTMPAIGPVR